MKYQIKKSRGFTLTELMIVVAIMGILAAIAGPSFARTIRHATVMKMARGFESALDAAAFNAKASGRPVKVCATNTINAPTPNCLTTLGDFTGSGNSENFGWIVFWDINDNDSVDVAAPPVPAEKVFKRLPFAQGRIKMEWSGGSNIITIMPRNTTGDNGTMCIYAPYGSVTSLSSPCSATSTFEPNLNEVKVILSTLGRVTFATE